jgi:hypothetical protein
MENNMEKAIELNIESWNKAGYPIPEAYKNWCIEHGREDLLGEISAESQFLPLPSRRELAEMFGLKIGSDIAHESLELPATEADVDSMMRFALEAMARDLNIPIPKDIAKESEDIDPNGELPSMEEIFGMKRKE